MAYCIGLAKLAGKATKSNPMVGSVLVFNGQIIGEGYHKSFGTNHAERNAIDNVSIKDKHLIRESTLYVTLEPCSRYSKTPPCIDYILKHEIKKVVIGTLDPNPREQHRSIDKMREQGIDLVIGILEEECKLLIRSFEANLRKRPYIILKWAQSKDGYLAKKGERTKLTNHFSDTLVHKWRSNVDGIMIGTNTAIIDNPHLTVRHWKGENPKRVILDRTGKLSSELHVFNQKTETIIITENLPKEAFLEIQYLQLNEWNLNDIISQLYLQDIYSIIIEGGRQLLTSFIDIGLWDEARIFTVDQELQDGLKSPNIEGKLRLKQQFITDNLVVIDNLTSKELK